MIGSPQRTVLVTAGERGVIRIFQPHSQQIDGHWESLIGHTFAVNQLKISSNSPFMLASASKDRSVRLWNIETGMCIATFHGEFGHRDDVVTVDLNHDCSKLVSGGNDHMIAIWDIATDEIYLAIQLSKRYDKQNGKRTFKTVYQPYPIFATRGIHRNYVDCVQWHGDMVISKVKKRTEQLFSFHAADIFLS